MMAVPIGAERVRKQQPEPVKNKQDQNLRAYGNNIERFLKEGRGWFPSKLPQNVIDRIEKVRHGPLQKQPYAQPTGKSLRIMSYNILAPSLVENVEYGNTKLEYINWDTRYPQLQKEILWAQPHILCLQEVEQKSEIIEWLHSQGYKGKAIKKPHPERHDGPATFYDSSRFEQVDFFDLPYAYKGDSNGKGGGLYEKGNCCLIIALKPLENPDRIYLIANTHLNFNSNRGDIKLSEVKLMTDALA